ncbi:winged helix-turn-helix transcriptional regulator [Gordonia polyisoprenivorans]|nr:winged helix-turn-helix transcriptional regulator [Gordonia polyisoprenivorans]QUD81898.1 winged helix-turn-helix transcriptional regulator [Gordonia polyisoprenivorans]
MRIGTAETCIRGKGDVIAVALVPEPVSQHDSCVFLRLGQEMFRMTEHRLAELGIRTRHFTILAVLDHSGPRSQQQLSVETGIDTSTMVAAIDELHAAGLAVRAKDPSDRRRSIVTVSDRGRATLADANAMMESISVEVFGCLSASAHKSLSATLAILNSAMPVGSGR